MKKMAKFVAIVLVLVLTFATFAGCEKKRDDGNYTYLDVFQTAPTTWNPHTYQTLDDGYINDYITMGLYGFVFNDTYDGYEVIPQMASAEPIDITKEIAKEGKWSIPEGETTGYAYKIPLNKKAVWDDGTKINAETYVYSMKELLNPVAKNYRAQDQIKGQLVLQNAAKYLYSGLMQYSDLTEVVDVATADVYTSITKDVYFLGDSMQAMYGAGYADYFKLKDGTDFVEKHKSKENSDGYFKVDAQILSELKELALAFGDPNPNAWIEFCSTGTQMEEFSFDGVGIWASGDYELTIVLDKKLTDFYLLYNLSSNWIVKEDLYEASKQTVGDTITSKYGTSLATTASYGPYKLTGYQDSKEIVLERNDKWYGYSDKRFDEMYQTTKILATYVSEASTRKEMFLKGQLDGYGLQAEDYAEYRSSDRTYFAPKTTLFFLILCGDLNGLTSREQLLKNVDKQMLSLKTFRQAMSVSFDKELFASTISPNRSGGYGIIGPSYIQDVETGETYRDTAQAKQVLVDFYGMEYGEGKKFATLDEAAEAITGFDPVLAKELFNKAYDEAVALGYIKDTDVVEIEYCSSGTSAFITKTLAYLNEKLLEVLKGTKLEGRVKIVESAPYGNEWSEKIRTGQSDTVLAGWSGGIMDPFNLTTLYTNPDNQYDALWFDATKVDLTLTLEGYNDGKPITMSLADWSEALNGTSKNGYNFGYDPEKVTAETRLTVLAAIEGEILKSYDYIPMLEDASAALLSHKLEYITDNFNPVLEYGGVPYLQYNFTDEEWSDYVSSQGGTLDYRN